MPSAAAVSAMPTFASPEEARKFIQSQGISFDDKGAPPAPPMEQWPGVIERTAAQATPSYTRDMPPEGGLESMGPSGIPPMPDQDPGRYDPSARPAEPIEPSYGGPLGYAQQLTRTGVNPLSAGLALTGPGALAASVMGDVGHEAARQFGAPEWAQELAGMFGALHGGNLAGKGMDILDRIAASPGTLAKSLSSDAGFQLSRVGDPMETMDRAGNVIFDEAGQALEARSAAAGPATVKGMAKRGQTPDTSTEDLIDRIGQTKGGVGALQAAIADPDGWMRLGPKGRAAIGAVFADNMGNAEFANEWMHMPPPYRRIIVPDMTAQENLSKAAKATIDAANAGQPSFWEKHGGDVINFLKHHKWSGAIGAAGALGGLHYGLSPISETAAGVAGLIVPPTIKALSDWQRSVPNMALGAYQGKAGENPLTPP